MHESIIANMTLEEMDAYLSINGSDPYSARLLELAKEFRSENQSLSDALSMEEERFEEEVQGLEGRVSELEEEIEELEEKIEELTTDE